MTAQSTDHRCSTCGRFMRKIVDPGWPDGFYWKCVKLFFDNYSGGWEHL